MRLPALPHCYLAALPVPELVTTNYDHRLKTALEGAGEQLSGIPHAPATSGRWLLEMHGCVSHPDDIVLTREDYLRYDQQRSALAGIVQSLLMTRHMPFLGFSLTDEVVMIEFDTRLDVISSRICDDQRTW